MGFLARLFKPKAVEGAGNLLDSADNFANGLRDAVTGEGNQLKLAELMATLAQVRLQISLAEAQSPRFFVAGARPFILWVIGCSMAMKFIVGPVLTTYTNLPFPDLDFGVMYSLLQIILGAELVGARTFEKLKGVQDKH